MNCTLTLDGHLSVGGDGCGCSDSSGVSNTTRGLSLRCESSGFQAIKSTDCAVEVSTPGSPGQNWIELPVTLGVYELLSLKASGSIKLRIGAAPATMPGEGAAFPVTSIDGSPFVFEADGSEVDVTFAGASLSAVQIAQQINAAAVLAGLAFLPASVLSSGQLQLQGVATGNDGEILVTTGLSAIGFADDAQEFGEGADVTLYGPFLAQFGPDGPSRIQISGQAKVEILAAGQP